MLIDFNRRITTLKGEPMKEGDGSPITVGGIVCNVISVLPTQSSIEASQRKKRFVLSVKITQAELPIEVDEADIMLIEGLINASTLPPFVTEQICCVLAGKPNPLERDEVAGSSAGAAKHANGKAASDDTAAKPH